MSTVRDYPRSLRRRFACLLAGLALICAPALGAAPPAEILDQQPGRTVLHLAPGPVRLVPLADGVHDRVEIDRFASVASPGSPDLPEWTGRLAIPLDALPDLRIVSEVRHSLGQIRPAPAPGRDVLNLPDDGSPMRPGRDFVLVREEDPAAYALPPGPVVRLGRIGRVREQRYVEILYSPLSWDPATGELLVREVTVEVRHGSGTEAALAPAQDAAFEPLYRAAILNYDAGRRLRAARPLAARTRESVVLTPPAWKISVSSDGLQRIDHATLSTAAPALLATDPRAWTLFNRGHEIPIRVIGESDGTFDSGDRLEFYGEARAEPNMVLELQLGAGQALWRDTDVGGTNVYVLRPTGGGATRMLDQDGSPGVLPAQPDFLETARFEAETLFVPLIGDDAWYWGPRTNSLDVGGNTRPATRSLSLDLPGLSGTPFSATLQVALRGTTSSAAVNPDHTATFRLDGANLGTLLFDGEVAAQFETTVPQASLSDPSTLEFTAEPTFNGSTEITNEFVLDHVNVVYRRLFDAAGGALTFPFPDGNFRFQVTGLPAADVQVLDLSQTVAGGSHPAPARLTGVSVVKQGATWTASFAIHTLGLPERRLLVTAGAAVVPVATADVVEDIPSSLADPGNGAGYLIITHRDLVDETPGSQFDQFRAAREAAGLPTYVAFVDDIYDEFGDSLPGPEALRNFLGYVFTSWSGWDADGDGGSDPPRYVLLLGDGTVDYRDRFDYGTTQQPFFDDVPAAILYQKGSIFTWFSSDVWITSPLGDDFYPEFLAGRLPTRSAAETEAVLAKVLDHETALPSGSWRAAALGLIDEGVLPSETSDFERIATEGEAFIPAPFTKSHHFYYSDFGGANPTAMHDASQASIDGGAALVLYLGHGNFNGWGLDQWYQSSDVASQTNGGKQSMLLVENCLSGGFAWHFAPSMGEVWTLTPGRGSIATFAPAGLSAAFVGEAVVNAVYPAIYGPPKVRDAGMVAALGVAAVGDAGLLIDQAGYELLGDPASRLALPAPGAPAGLAAVAGNGLVQLSWTGSPDPVVGYRVFRATNATGPYVAVTPSPVPVPAFDDTTVVNSTTYYYAVVGVDSGGFESAWSNFNADCGLGGPDCVSATPVNPDPPSQVQGVGVEPAMGSFDRLRVFWNANPEGDLALYRVRYGTVQGVHDQQAEVGPASTEAILTDLSEGTRYFVVVEAENTGGLIGVASDEVEATPQLILGIRPPAVVGGLQVVVAPDDPSSLDLSWDPVLLDAYGFVTQVVSYEVYRGSSPTFLPLPGAPEGTVAAPVTTYRDTGAALAGASYYYFVVAVDAAGNRSAIGSDLPGGILDLSLSLRPDGVTVDLDWTPVTETLGGAPAAIVGYELHGAAWPVGRASISGATLLQTIPGPPATHVPPGGLFYYTVVAVDARGSKSPF